MHSDSDDSVTRMVKKKRSVTSKMKFKKTSEAKDSSGQYAQVPVHDDSIEMEETRSFQASRSETDGREKNTDKPTNFNPDRLPVFTTLGSFLKRRRQDKVQSEQTDVSPVHTSIDRLGSEIDAIGLRPVIPSTTAENPTQQVKGLNDDYFDVPLSSGKSNPTLELAENASYSREPEDDVKPETGKPSSSRESLSSSTTSTAKMTTERNVVIERMFDAEIEALQELEPEDKMQVMNQTKELIYKLGIPRVFYDPEVDLVNRFCLEYTSICVKTDDSGFFTTQSKTHYKRVYDYMDKRTHSMSTPIQSTFCGPEVPVILTKLFLGDFRVNSKGEASIGIIIPIFAHNHKLVPIRFQSIVQNVFARKRMFYKNIDISRHHIDDLV